MVEAMLSERVLDLWTTPMAAAARPVVVVVVVVALSLSR